MSYSHLTWKLETPQQERFQTAWRALLLRKSRLSEKEKQYCLEILTCNHSIHKMGLPDFTLYSHWSKKGKLNCIYAFSFQMREELALT